MPGWRGRQVADEALRFHAVGAPSGEAEGAVDEARGLLAWLADAVAPSEVAYKVNLQREAEWLGAMSDAEMARALRGPRPRPVYFSEVAAEAEARGLAYLADADHGWNRGARLPPALAADVARLAGGDLARLEQYQDFVVGRTARRSLLTRRGAPRERDAWGARVADLWVASRCARAGQDEATGAPRWRVGAVARAAANRAEDATFEALRRAWPEALSVRELFAAVAREVATGDDRDGVFEGFCEALVGHWAAGLVDVRATPLSGGLRGATPSVRAVARRALARGAPVVLSADQVPEPLDEPLRTFATWVDGTRRGGGGARASRGRERGAARRGLRGAVERALERLEGLGLLEGWRLRAVPRPHETEAPRN